MRQERINKLANAVEAQDMDESMQDHVGLSLAGNFRRRLLTAEDEKLLDQLLAQVSPLPSTEVRIISALMARSRL